MKMTAVKTGFYKGVMVRPGEHFEYDDRLAPLVPLPKWAVPFGTPLPPKPTPFLGKPPLTFDEVEQHHAKCRVLNVCDTKPLDAQLAMYEKTGTRPPGDPIQRHGFF